MQIKDSYEFMTALMYACEADLLSSVRCLVEAGANIGARNMHSDSAACLAASNGRVDVLSFLVLEAKVVDVDATDHSTQGVTLLGIAACKGELECTR